MTTVAFIGAGSVKFTSDLVANILAFPELATAALRLHDVDASRLATAGMVAESVARQLGAAPRVSMHASRRDALEGADFVINTVLIGGAAAAATDLEVPERFGVRQTVGDTLGIGGILRGVRTLPFLRQLAEDMAVACPDAFLLNYTNPMAMSIGYLARIAPSLKAFGLCHSVHHTVADLCALLGVDREEVVWTSAGVNHQAWVLRFEHAGENLYDRLDARIRADPELRRSLRVDMYRRFGFFPTETSKHNSEYVPWYLPRPDEVDRLRLPGVSDRLRANADDVRESEQVRTALERGEEVRLPDGAVEYAPQIIHSVVSGSPRVIQVNTPNTGLIGNLPAGAPVEVGASVDASGVHPWHVGDLPAVCAALNRSYLNVVELTIEAVLREDPRAIRHAAMLDPSTAAALPVDRIWDLCDALVAAHGDVLPRWARAPVSADGSR
ncbi:alpha-galactosidase [Amnibacterium sp. CER49]|uniref:alpha-galactosidase n=1 Tax=Amnibacterium sp. CER49 TaxID=3039161 RepID=UPI00244C54E6|nr:alpha-galactosidase [Amnibacterium sp. CER49]MDH2442614.1 alpha-galactosidase [Amnibacterium sp. CER49]